MPTTPKDLKYTESHEWVHQAEDGIVTIGITDYAQESLGDITFVELPESGATINKGETFGVVESVKAASDLLLPVSGKIVECNPDIDANPELVNDSPYEQGWMIRVEVSDKNDLDKLLSSEDYEKIC